MKENSTKTKHKRMLKKPFLTLLLIVLAYNSAKSYSLDQKWYWMSNNGTTLVMRLAVRVVDGSAHKLNSMDDYVDYTDAGISAVTGVTFLGSFSGTTNFTSSGYTDYGPGNAPVNSTPGSGDPTSYGAFDIKLSNISAPTAGVNIASTNGAWVLLADVSFTVADPTATMHLDFDPDFSGPGGSDVTMFEAGGTTSNFLPGTYSNNSFSPLPVTFIGFSAYIQHQETVLNWATGSEINNNFFTVERSRDGEHFETLLTKQGNGNSSETIYYTAYDENPLPGTSYYRLSQTDYNGSSAQYKIIAVNNTDVETFAISSISPTSFSDNTTLNYTLPSDAEVKMTVTDLNGRLLEDKMISGRAGGNTYRFENASGWKQGLYLVNLYYEGRLASSKMVKQ